MSLLIRNIKELVQVREQAPGVQKGEQMRALPTIKNAWLLVEGDRIANFGEMDSCPERADQEINAAGKMVFPSWCDSHTHIVYAAGREGEFVDRIKGLGYEEIAKKGGGILNSARRLQEMSEDELYESAAMRLEEVKGFGTGAIEIKSGYGLTYDAELKMLRVIRRLKESSEMTIKANFLGAHAIPMEYKENREGYMDLLLNKMIPDIVDQGLADYIDVFCDRGFFTVEESARIMEAGAKHGLRAKIHANELDYSGGVQVGVEHNALSVDHLECVGDAEIEALMGSETMPTLLPSTAFFLNLEYAPARKMIDAGLPIALASDYNPGSTPSGRMPFVLSLACIKMHMLPEEAVNAATINSSYAMDCLEEHGSITNGKIANLFISKTMSSIAFMPYAFGSDLVEQTIIKGKLT